MPRLVIPEHAGVGRFAAKTVTDVPKDEYKDRLVKYIPAESVALYTFTDKLLIGYYGIDGSGVARGAPGLPNQPWKMHAGISTLAFCFWVYTLGGSLILIHHWYHVVLAALAAPVFTFVAGWFEPRA